MTKVLGIDEAGRGPVIGPLVMAGVMIEEGREKMLGEVKDSKLIPHKKRLKLDKHLRENFEYKITIAEPKEIDEALNSTTLNLNWLEAHKQAEIINSLKPDVAIIDCPSTNPPKFTEYLKNLLEDKSIKLIVEHKADAIYPVCSAGSILAKVERENQMDKIKEKYGKTGSGYPADPKTKEFVKNNWDKHPEIFRKTWATYKKISEKEKRYQKTLL
jgi:ribonuclease HII